jgi:hypothetical protein
VKLQSTMEEILRLETVSSLIVDMVTFNLQNTYAVNPHKPYGAFRHGFSRFFAKSKTWKCIDSVTFWWDGLSPFPTWPFLSFLVGFWFLDFDSYNFLFGNSFVHPSLVYLFGFRFLVLDL